MQGGGAPVVMLFAGVLAVSLGVTGLVLQFRAGDGGSVQLAAAGASGVLGGLVLGGASVLKGRESEFDGSPLFLPLLAGVGLSLPIAVLLADVVRTG